jgi:hypothetical protein
MLSEIKIFQLSNFQLAHCLKPQPACSQNIEVETAVNSKPCSKMQNENVNKTTGWLSRVVQLQRA